VAIGSFSGAGPCSVLVSGATSSIGDSSLSFLPVEDDVVSRIQECPSPLHDSRIGEQVPESTAKWLTLASPGDRHCDSSRKCSQETLKTISRLGANEKVDMVSVIRPLVNPNEPLATLALNQLLHPDGVPLVQ